MKNRKVTLMWGISLIIISISTLINAVSSIIGKELSATTVRIVGIVTLITFPFFIFSTVKKFIALKNKD